MRHAVYAGLLAAFLLAAWAREKGWIALPDSAIQVLLLCLTVAFIPLYVQGLREGELVVPPQTVRRRTTPRLFWFVAVVQAALTLALLAYLGVGLLRGLAAG